MIFAYIPRTLELFVDSLLTKTLKITNTRNAKTLSPSHLKQCIMAEQRFDFLRELVKNIPDISLAEEAAANYNEDDVQSSPEQDSFSDAASDTNKPSDLTQRPTSSIHIAATPLNLSRNGVEIQENGLDLSKMRRTRSLQQLEQQQQQKSAVEIEVIERLQHSVVKPVTNTSKCCCVIMHTNALLPKFLRAESTPEADGCSTAKRVKVTGNTTKVMSTPVTPTSIATIPAPIVSFDFCSKPVVKIDYSNIPIAVLSGDDEIQQKKNRKLPQSAPLQLTVGSCEQPSTVFDFSTPPISINIDLSSIKINKATASCSSTTTSTINNCNTMPKAGNISTRAHTAVKTLVAKNTQLELDEDYDNI